MNIIHNKSCEYMEELATASVDLVVTSPPYFDLKEYATWPTYADYMTFVDKVVFECFRVLKPGAWAFWNVQDSIPCPPTKLNKERYSEALAADAIHSFQRAGFKYEKGVVWYKGQGTATQRLFGSYPKPGMILISGLTEHILFFRKPRGSYKREIDPEIVEKSKLTKEEWSKWALDFWQIAPATKQSHPAPFPVEIPNRLIRMFTYVGDLVLDPFFGAGSTGVAAKSCGRNYVGYEIHKEYIREAKERISMDIFDDLDIFDD